VLAGAADVLSTYVERAAGIFAGRLNGSDFALCLPLPGLAAETADSLRSALAANPAWRASRAEWVVAAVDGLRDVGASQALAAVDAALARAEAGDGIAIEPYGDEVQVAVGVVGARAWRAQIAAALDEGRIALASFEVVDRDRRLIHLECPLRVQLQPDGDFHSAERWLALARRSRLLPQVDLASVRLALKEVAADQRPRAIHACPASLASPGFIDDMTNLLRQAPQAARWLSIECIEAGGPTDLAMLTRAAAAWRPFGVLIGVEHAGAAPQQMAGLKAAGVDYVKVDARHLRGAATDDAVRRYALSLVTLIHGLGLSALAQGVDQDADLKVIWTLGFDGAAGPAVSRIESQG
jgi:EAL domain-containing protein (putative c-di-GMP-specific phosphodiesterase class I)